MEAGEEDEESDSEEESPPRADSGLPHARYNVSSVEYIPRALHLQCIYLHRDVALVDDLYLRTMPGCVHEQKAQGVQLVGVANKKAGLQCLWALPNYLKHNGANFSTILTDSLCLQVTQMPRSRDLVILC